MCSKPVCSIGVMPSAVAADHTRSQLGWLGGTPFTGIAGNQEDAAAARAHALELGDGEVEVRRSRAPSPGSRRPFAAAQVSASQVLQVREHLLAQRQVRR